jgi:hypothetical protein
MRLGSINRLAPRAVGVLGIACGARGEDERAGAMTDQRQDYLSDDAQDIARRAAVRLCAFLELEVAEIPAWHPTACRYVAELEALHQAVGLFVLP